MSFVAQKVIKMGKDKNGKEDVRQPGDMVPEALGWKQGVRQSYINTGHLIQIGNEDTIEKLKKDHKENKEQADKVKAKNKAKAEAKAKSEAKKSEDKDTSKAA